MKMTPPRTIDDYIEARPPAQQEKLRQTREVIQQTAPEATEAIRYGIPTFVLGENLVHFAGFAKHIGFYPTSSAIAAFARELALYKCGRGSVQFPADQPIPFDLVKRMVRFRVEEVQSKPSLPDRKKRPSRT